MTHPRIKTLVLFLLGISAMVAGCLFIEHLRLSSGMALAAVTYAKILNVYYYFRLLLEDRVLAISFWCILLLTLCLQYLLPAKAGQKIFSVGFAQDLIWFFYETMLNALILVFYVEYLTRFYHQYFSGLTISPLGLSPPWIRIFTVRPAGGFPLLAATLL